MDSRQAITSKDRDGVLDWIRTATYSGLGPVVRFAYGLKDLGAVIPAIETPCSNGQIEGQINRLEAIKRQMYDVLASTFNERAFCRTVQWRLELHRKCGNPFCTGADTGV